MTPSVPTAQRSGVRPAWLAGAALLALAAGGALWMRGRSPAAPELLNRPGVVHSLAWSPDGKTLAQTAGPLAVLLDPDTGTMRRSLHFPSHTLGALSFSPDGRLLAAAGMTGEQADVIVWEAATGKVVRTLSGAGFWGVLAFSPDGRLLAAGTSQGKDVTLFDTGTWTAASTVRGIYANNASFRPDGRVLALGTRNGFRLHDVTAGKTIRAVPAPSGDVEVHFSPDGRHLVTSGHNTNVRLWNADTGALERRIEGVDDWGRKRLGMYTQDGTGVVAPKFSTVALYDATTGERTLTLVENLGRTWEAEMAVHPTQPRVAIAPTVGYPQREGVPITIWDTKTGRLLHKYPGYSTAEPGGQATP